MEIIKGSRSSALTNCTDFLELILGQCHDAGKLDVDQVRGLHEITLKASTLSEQICTASETYVLEYPVMAKASAEDRVLRKDIAGNCRLIDIGTSRPVPGSTICYDADGRGGEMLCTIFPGLYQVREGGRDKVVSKATIIVKLDRPVQGKVKD